ncbi:MAG TPA: hypothetical protein PLP19_13095 [bacterium]|mgnify:CR=1 FL=1|nr:hypothetical protein [bacterium]HPN44422.1 hypothetical protein [bacterium]
MESKNPESTKENKNKAYRKELLDEIGALRSQFREILNRYQANVEAEMVWCINSLSSTDPEELPKAAKDKHELTQMLNELHSIKIKPQKGRLKDIRKIDKLITALSEKLSE